MNFLRICSAHAACSLLSVFVFYIQFIKPEQKAAAETQLSKDDSNVYAMSLLKNITHTHCATHFHAVRIYVWDVNGNK